MVPADAPGQHCAHLVRHDLSLPPPLALLHLPLPAPAMIASTCDTALARFRAAWQLAQSRVRSPWCSMTPTCVEGRSTGVACMQSRRAGPGLSLSACHIAPAPQHTHDTTRRTGSCESRAALSIQTVYFSRFSMPCSRIFTRIGPLERREGEEEEGRKRAEGGVGS